MAILDILKSLFSNYKIIDIKKLPSQGYFYPNDMELKIKKADIEDIIIYETSIEGDNLLSVINNVKRVVCNNVSLNKDYKYEDIKAVDIIFLFLEIVKYSLNKSINVPYFDEESGNLKEIEFDSKSFNYFDFTSFMKNYNYNTNEFKINGYKFSLPSIGVETMLTNFFINKNDTPSVDVYNTYLYDFVFFTGNKRTLTFEEIENLIIIFNQDIEEDEKKKITKIVNKFSDMVGYTLQKDGKVIDVKSKIDLVNIWK